jgi:hypothetical protein
VVFVVALWPVPMLDAALAVVLSSGDDGDDGDDADAAVDEPSAVSAEAVDCPAKIAAPIPRATARPPTRPTYRPADTSFSASRGV